MFDILQSVNSFVKVRFLQDKEVIDNLIFRLHYRATAGILFAFSILCAANTLIGDPIDCLGDGVASNGMIDTYCWIKSTYTLPHLQDEQPKVNGKVIAPGVGPHSETDEKTYHTYYQWVPFVLFLQGILFYFPHWMWKNWEDGKIRKISDGMRGSTIDIIADTKENQEVLVKYLVDSMHYHDKYAICYFFSELLNFINVIGNIFLVDEFLGGSFLTYGSKVIEYSNTDQMNRTDPMIVMFPRVTKCSLNTYGFSGSTQYHDILCVLPVNILNEKIYIFMWFWFIILSVLSALALFYSMAIIAYPPIRKFVLERRFKYHAPSGISSILEKAQLGDFLVLHLLGRNMCVTMYHEILNKFSDALHDYKPRYR